MFLTVFLASLPLLVFCLYRKLHYYRIRQYADWPQLQPSLVWGHLKVLQEIILSGEKRRHIDMVFREIKESLGNPPVFILDLRPLRGIICVVCDHTYAEDVSRNTKEFPYSLPKASINHAFDFLLGPSSIVTSQGEDWKGLRKQLNPGFAPRHLMTLLPCILDKTWLFLETLDRYAANGEEFSLGEVCINLTFDVIGAVTMDQNFNAQLDPTEQGEIVSVYRQLIDTYRTKSSMSFGLRSPRKVLRRRQLTRRVDALLKEHIKRKFTEQNEIADPTTPKDKSRSVLSLSLQAMHHLDPATLNQTCDQLKTFLFAGHDTTSILLQWAIYELSRTPRALASIRREIDSTFGSEDLSPSVVREKLLADHGEELLNRMSYTSAVIKEILRLYPPSGTARTPPPRSNFTFTLSDSTRLVVDEKVIYNCEYIIHRDEAVYGSTKDDFIPERWLGDSDTSMKTNVDVVESRKEPMGRIPPSAWRPFERGLRNCIGQELANIEARIVLASVVRRYEFRKVGIGEFQLDSEGLPVLNEKGQFAVKEELYPTTQVTAKPVDGTRMKVRLAPDVSKTLS